MYCLHLTTSANTFHSDSTQTSLLKFEAGFDMFYFLNTFRRTYSPEIETPIFSLTVIRHIEPEIEIRLVAGLGKVSYSIRKNSLLPKKYNETNMSVRLGVEKEVACSTKWMFFYGAELFFRKDLIQTVQPTMSEVITEIQHNTSYGIMPLAGIKYFITPRIILSTEMDFIMSFYHDSDINLYKINPKENSLFLNHGFSTSFYAPNNIFLLFKF